MREKRSNVTREVFLARRAQLLEYIQKQRESPNDVQLIQDRQNDAVRHFRDYTVTTKGPGDFLHDAILAWVGEGPTRECGCTDRIDMMNAWGPAGCREHLDEIVGWLAEEATKRGWWKYAVAVPGSRYFIKRMVLSAIKKTEKNEAVSLVAAPQATAN